MMEKLTTREQYDEIKARVEQLIAEATAKGSIPSSASMLTSSLNTLSYYFVAVKPSENKN